MIYLVHGNDYESSYRRLTQIASKYADHKIIHLDPSTPQQILDQTLQGESLLAQKEIIILEDLISTLPKLPQQANIILWEKRQVSAQQVKKLPKGTTVELHNLKTTLYEFLDSLVPGSKKAQILIKKQSNSGLLWHLQNRLFLLLLIKMGFDVNEVANITQKTLMTWQWQNLADQAAKFSTGNLRDFYSGALKIDFLIKTGRTSLAPTTITSILLLKYLK